MECMECEKLEKDKVYQIYNIVGKPKFWLNCIKSFLWMKRYVVQLQIEGEDCIRTLKFRSHPSTDDVAILYIDEILLSSINNKK